MWPIFHIFIPLLIGFAFVAPVFAADQLSPRLLSTYDDDPRLSLRAGSSGESGGTDELGMHLELPPGDIGRTRFDLATTSQEGSAPQFSRLTVDQKLRVDGLDGILPGKFDLGVHASRQRDASAWGLALKPTFRMQQGGLALDADMSLGKLADTDGPGLGANYTLTTSYALNNSVSLGLNGQGALRRDGSRPQVSIDQMTPQLSGRYFIRDGATLHYRMGWDMNLENGERSPDVELKLDLRF